MTELLQSPVYVSFTDSFQLFIQLYLSNLDGHHFEYHSDCLLSCFFTENVDLVEARYIFETHYSHIFYLFYDVFVATEAGIKIKREYSMGRLFR